MALIKLQVHGISLFLCCIDFVLDLLIFVDDVLFDIGLPVESVNDLIDSIMGCSAWASKHLIRLAVEALALIDAQEV